MHKLVMTAALVMLMSGSASIAQSGSGTSSLGKQGPWPAPTGHRQPRVDQVPADTSNSASDAVKREDADLDRKLKSICRGC